MPRVSYECTSEYANHLVLECAPHGGPVVLRHRWVPVVGQLEAKDVRHAVLVEPPHQPQQTAVRRVGLQCI